jgi:SAM-dependent methyltransferase
MARLRGALSPFIHSGAAVLDAGCGREMTFAREIGPLARRIVGVDIDTHLRRYEGAFACRGNLGRLPFRDESFDAIVSLSVMEHLDDPAQVLAELHRVLRPGGGLVLLTPNRFDYVSILAQATPHWFHQWIVSRTLAKSEQDVFPTLYRANTRRRLTELLRRSCLAPERIEFFNQYPAYLMFSRTLFSLGVAYERVTSRWELLAPLRGWLLAVARKEPRTADPYLTTS